MASNKIFQKAEDWLDDLETVGGYAAEKIGDVTKDMPIVKALGNIAANPTRQEIGAQAVNLSTAFNKGMQESFGGDPVDIALNYGPGAIGAMTAYHGTPHKIVGGFKKEAIGTGEGAQAFGHGFYATEEREIAKEYARRLSDIQGNPINRAQSGLIPTGTKASIQEIIDSRVRLIEHLKNLEKQGNTSVAGQIKRAEQEIEELSKKGRIYTLDIPEKDVMLDWDKPLSQQPDLVKNKAEEIVAEFKKINPYAEQILNKGGKEFYSAVAAVKGSPVKASEYLNSIGVKGIRYKAGQISGAKTDASNYVIFEPEDIKILAEDFLDQ